MKYAKYLVAVIAACGAILVGLGALAGATLVVYLDWRDRDANANPR